MSYFCSVNLFMPNQLPLKRSLQDRLVEGGGALEVGVHDCFQFLHHAQAALYFSDDALLLSERWERGIFYRCLINLRHTTENLIMSQEQTPFPERSTPLRLEEIEPQPMNRKTRIHRPDLPPRLVSRRDTGHLLRLQGQEWQQLLDVGHAL